jgi:hypothetical protein
MKYLIELTKSWKHRNLLHIVGGFLIALIPNLVLNNVLGLLVGCWLCAIVGHVWEIEQVKNYKAQYSKKDIFLSIFGGLIIGAIQLLN